MPYLPFGCGDTSLLANLSSGVKGMAGLGGYGIGLPSLFFAALGLDKKFTFCLPSTTRSYGVLFFGKGPYSLLPGSTDVSLTFTPLILNPISTAGSYYEGDPSSEYFINIST